MPIKVYPLYKLELRKTPSFKPFDAALDVTWIPKSTRGTQCTPFLVEVSVKDYISDALYYDESVNYV